MYNKNFHLKISSSQYLQPMFSTAICYFG